MKKLLIVNSNLHIGGVQEALVNLLGEITGETASADLAHEIFGRFCVGK